MKHLILIALLFSSFAVNAASYSYIGNLESDDDFAIFNFNLASDSNVNIRTWSYAGGTNAVGDDIVAGGFDPLVIVFDSTGTWIDMNDDIDGYNGVYDSELNLYDLVAGDYILALAQFGHDYLTQMPRLEDMIWDTYSEDFDGFTSAYAVDINVSPIDTNPSEVPLPAAVWLFGSAFMGLFGLKKKSVKA